jgi:hypothetical protein
MNMLTIKGFIQGRVKPRSPEEQLDAIRLNIKLMKIRRSLPEAWARLNWSNGANCRRLAAYQEKLDKLIYERTGMIFDE